MDTVEERGGEGRDPKATDIAIFQRFIWRKVKKIFTGYMNLREGGEGEN